MKPALILSVFVCFTFIAAAVAQPILTVTQGEEADLAAPFDAADLIQGLIPNVLAGDAGWHPVNTDPADQLPAFTDGIGIRSTGLTGLLNDFPGAGAPAKRVEYVLPVPADINEIRIFTGNEGRDGRVFHTYTVRFSADEGQTYTEPLYVQSHLSGAINNMQNNAWRVVLSQLTAAAGPLAPGVTHLQLDLYAVDNTQGQMRDPFDGLNPFTGLDDGLTAAFVSPLVWEIDVLGTEPPPRLRAAPLGDALQLTWLARTADFVVQTATQLDPPDWSDLSPQPAIVSDGFRHTITMARGSEPGYFRLRIALP